MFKKCAKPVKKSNFFTCFSRKGFLLTVGFFVFASANGYWLFSSLYPSLPKKKNPLCLYSNQCRDDLKRIVEYSLEKSKKSIHLVSFGLSDPSTLHLLEKKAKLGLQMNVFYDERGSHPFTLCNHKAFLLHPPGLIHQKILVLDQKRVFLGSANFTRASLQMHDNLILGFYSPSLAHFLIQETPFSFTKSFKTSFGNQNLKLFLFPDKNNEALFFIKNEILAAKKSITVCMFTLTHKELIEALIQAHQKGVKVQVHIDSQSFKGASKKAVLVLKKAHVPVFANGHIALFHHKFALIDNKILFAGSANWTYSAFKKNRECFFALYPLNHHEKKFLKKLTHIIDLEKTIL